MGLDVVRFRGGAVDEELICPICTGVLEAPLQAPVSNTLLQNNSIFFTPWYLEMCYYYPQYGKMSF